MNDKTLVRELAWVIVVKLVLIFFLWWLFFRDQGVAVDTGAMDRALLFKTDKTEAVSKPPEEKE